LLGGEQIYRVRKRMDGYYLIDFALFKDSLPLLYDQRYLEISYLILKLSQVPFTRLVDLLSDMSEDERLDPALAPVELAGVRQVIGSARDIFREWGITGSSIRSRQSEAC
jgi:hypothetical protein